MGVSNLKILPFAYIDAFWMNKISEQEKALSQTPKDTYQEQGSVWGWLGCKFMGMNFTGGGWYDWYSGKCHIKGDPVADVWW